MKYRILGRTQLNVSEIGFGSWGISGNSYGATSDSESLKALSFALDQGVNFIDTADIYGFGKSEELVGTALKGKRGQVVLATKGGWDFTQGAVRSNYDPSYIKEAIHSSLKRLNTDYIDVYQLHNPPDSLLENFEALLSQLLLAQKEGKIRFIGVSIFVPWQGEAWVNTGVMDTVQCIYNLVDQRVGENFLSFAEEKKIGVIAREPLECGMLTGKYTKEVEFPKNDHRRRWSKEKIELILKKVEVLKTRYEKLKTEPIPFSLGFVLRQKPVSVVIPGAKTSEQVAMNLLASENNPVSIEIFKELQELYETNDIFKQGFFEKKK